MRAQTRPSESPDIDCALCSRLASFRDGNRAKFPDWFNAPVPSFHPDPDSKPVRLLIVGLAPGLRGANKTGRPFTGDYAGDLLYATLIKYGLAEGSYGAHPEDGLRLKGTMITNAVRCVPPENKPTGAEITACRPFLSARIAALPDLRVILALGGIAHGSILAALGLKKSAWKFGHGSQHRLPDGLMLADSYHCSRYNTNTGRLTEAMFHSVFENLRPLIGG
ncbi:MAG: uracil-DNA glycosylase [Rhodospirillales bacterium]|nr:uracil-DNA glycosylase [Rhodospirillales bacterium]